MSSRWRQVRFGDVVRQSLTTADPESGELARYVAGEHMDTDSLRVRRWGEVGDGYLGPAFHRRFNAGQVLYGSRRTYLRKVALADFDGICANTTFVCEADGRDLIPALLPFVMQMESFHRHSMAKTKGGVTPYVNWSDLTSFEFMLPDVAAQGRVAELLGASARYVVRLEEALAAADAMLDAYADEGFKRVEANGGACCSLGRVLDDCQYGLSTKASATGSTPIFRMMNLEGGVVVENDLKYVDLSEDELAAYRLAPGDLLFNRTNSADLVGKVGIYRLSGSHVFASYLMRLRAVEGINPEYLNAFLNSPLGQRRVRSYATHGVSQSNINATNLRKVLVPLTDQRQQKALVDAIGQLREARDAAHRQLTATKSLHRALVTRVLEQGGT